MKDQLKRETDVDAGSKRKYGFCKRTGAWVPRDAMYSIHCKVNDKYIALRFAPEAHEDFVARLRELHMNTMRSIHCKVHHPDGGEEHISLRFSPEEHDDFVARLRDLEWDRELKTRDELYADGDVVKEVDIDSHAETKNWYGLREVVKSDDDTVLIAKASLRRLSRADSLQKMENIIVDSMGKISVQVLLAVLREMLPRVTRWDYHAAVAVDPWEALQREYIGLGLTPVDVVQVSADLDQMLVVSVWERNGDHEVRVDIVEHGESQLAHSRSGRLNNTTADTCD